MSVINQHIHRNLITKVILLSVIAFVSVLSGFSQTTRYWVGGTSASYNSPSSWSKTFGGAGDGAPTAGDLLIIDGSDISSNPGSQTGAVTITNIQNQTIGRLTLQNNADVTLSILFGTRTLIIGNSAGDDLVINNGTSLSFENDVNITLNGSANAAIDGTLSIRSGSTYNTDGASVVTNVNGTIINEGNVTCTTASKLVFNAASTYNHSQDGGDIPTATWDATSNCDITGITSSTGTQPGNQNQA